MSEVNVGQILFQVVSKTEIREVEVESVGRVYFYLKGFGNKYPINKKNLMFENKVYSQLNFQLYVNKQEILDRKERFALIDLLKIHFDWSGSHKENTLEQLRNAKNALGL